MVLYKTSGHSLFLWWEGGEYIIRSAAPAGSEIPPVVWRDAAQGGRRYLVLWKESINVASV